MKAQREMTQLEIDNELRVAMWREQQFDLLLKGAILLAVMFFLCRSLRRDFFGRK